MKFFDYLREIQQFYRDNGLKIDPAPKTRVNKQENGEFDPFIQTGSYDPTTNTIEIFINGRHLKDILRSYCHELIHRNQHLEMPDKFENMNMSGNLVENQELEDIEADAFRRGNLMFRKWTETKKRHE